MNKTIKKYPIFYQGEEYEIRIEKPYIKTYNYDEYICIYKVTKYRNWFGKEKPSYELLYSILLGISENNTNSTLENYYIDLFKNAFNLYLRYKDTKIKKDEEKFKQLVALEKWDGVIL